MKNRAESRRLSGKANFAYPSAYQEIYDGMQPLFERSREIIASCIQPLQQVLGYAFRSQPCGEGHIWTYKMELETLDELRADLKVMQELTDVSYWNPQALRHISSKIR